MGAEYVVLNFEDSDPNFTRGSVFHSSSSVSPAGIGGSARGTLEVFHRKAKKKSSLFNRRKVLYYGAQQLIDEALAHKLKVGQLKEVREDCRKAKKIVVIIHGMPEDTTYGFTNNGLTGTRQLCTWGHLGRLFHYVLPERSKPYDVSLIMCYGARSEDFTLDHMGQLKSDDLKTSFAYRFFREMSRKRSVRMSARTGAVSTDGKLHNIVETEARVGEVIEESALKKAATNKLPALRNKRDDLLSKGMTKEQWNQLLKKYTETPNSPAGTEAEKLAKKYSYYTGKGLQDVHAKWEQAIVRQGVQLAKYGKLIYCKEGADLVILNRYGNPDGDMGEYFELYRGRML